MGARVAVAQLAQLLIHARHMTKLRTLLITATSIALGYFAVGACLLRFALEPLVFPQVVSSAPAKAPLFVRVSGADGNAMLVRRYGTPTVGCIVFFPGQHGLISTYEEQLFPAFSEQGIAVLAVAYPGQNGASGTAHLPEIFSLATQVVAEAQAICPDHRVVVYGRSLGSMVAAYVAATSHPAGLILESAAPSLSSAIRVRLNSHWYLAPMRLLPVRSLLAHDYSLADALSSMRNVPAVVFQGTADYETPVTVLRQAGVPQNLRLAIVVGGTHSTTDFLARERILQTTLSMLRVPRNGASISRT